MCGTFLKSSGVQRLAKSDGLAELSLWTVLLLLASLQSSWVRTTEAVQVATLC